jgi:hypothetical protein
VEPDATEPKLVIGVYAFEMTLLVALPDVGPGTTMINACCSYAQANTTA